MRHFNSNDEREVDDFDHEEDVSRHEHYVVHCDKPMLMPSLDDMPQVFGRISYGSLR